MTHGAPEAESIRSVQLPRYQRTPRRDGITEYVVFDADELVDALAARGMTRADFASVADVSRETMSHATRGRPVQMRIARRVLTALTATPPLI